MSISSDTAAAVSGLIILGWGLWVWGNGLIGMARTETIRRTYGSLIDGFWAFMLAVIVGNALQEMAGVKTELLFSNVVAFVVTVALNWLVIRADQRRFYDRCDRALAKKIIRAERQMAYSIITRLTLIFTIGTIATLFVVTDTSDYYLGKDGRIYRVKDTMSL